MLDLADLFVCFLDVIVHGANLKYLIVIILLLLLCYIKNSESFLCGRYLLEQMQLGIDATDKLLRISTFFCLFYLLSQQLCLIEFLLLSHVLIFH